MVNLLWAHHMDTINALMKLQSLDVTDKEILDIHEFMNKRIENSVRMSRDSSLLYFDNRNNGSNFGPK
jgi:hypothetical protein